MAAVAARASDVLSNFENAARETIFCAFSDELKAFSRSY